MSDTAAGGLRAPPAPLTGVTLAVVAVLTALANLFATLDLTIANVSIPLISSSLGVSPHEGTWVITSYAVAEAITVPLTGWLARRFGPARTFIYALSGFGLASALCGLATSFEMLLFFRVVQGLAGGPMIPLSQTLLLSIFPREKSGTAMSIWAMTAVLGPVLGPLLGGYICDHVTWHWIFLINVPVILVTAFFVGSVLIKRDPAGIRVPIDVVGMVMMVLWISALQIMLDKGQQLDWFASPWIVGLLIVAVVGFVAFLIWELTEPNPIVNLRIFQERSFLVATIVIVIGFASYFGSVVITPLWLQTNMGYTPFLAGLVNAPPGAVVFLLAPFAAWVATRVDTRILISTALVIFGCSFFWRANFASNVTIELLLINQAINGVCIAFYFAPAMGIALSRIKPQDIAAAAGLLSFCRTTGLAVATSMSTTEWQNATIRSRAALVDRYEETNGLQEFTAQGFSPSESLAHLDTALQDQAVMLATNNMYYIFASAMIVGAVLMWLAPKMRRAGAAGGAH